MQRQYLVLLPGLDGTDVFLQPLMRSLPDHIIPLVVRYPDDPDAAADYSHLIEYVRTVVIRLPSCHVLGWSFGGPLALRIAEERPDLVRSVVLAATFVRTPNAWMRRLSLLFNGPSVAAFRALTRVAARLHRTPPGWRADLAATWRLASSRSIAARLRTLLSVDERSRLRSCRQPVLYLGAADDWLVPCSNVRDVVSARTSVIVRTLPGSHLAMYWEPRGFADAVGQFIGWVVAGEDRSFASTARSPVRGWGDRDDCHAREGPLRRAESH